MGGHLSVTFSSIYLTKLEKDQVKPLKQKFYRRFVDDVLVDDSRIRMIVCLKI